jgi:hypothetical protein
VHCVRLLLQASRDRVQAPHALHVAAVPANDLRIGSMQACMSCVRVLSHIPDPACACVPEIAVAKGMSSPQTSANQRLICLWLQFGVGQSATAAIWPFRRGARKRRQAARQKRVLVLMSNTGGGHKASAQAIEAGFKQMYGDKCAPGVRAGDVLRAR